jgi:hypothetical protein
MQTETILEKLIIKLIKFLQQRRSTITFEILELEELRKIIAENNGIEDGKQHDKNRWTENENK